VCVPNQSEKSSLRSYAAQTAEALGVSKRTVEKDIARGSRIAPEILAEVSGTDLDKGVVLDRLA
jgi:predicted DNA-binding transcriptional regulator YafY